MQPRRFQISTPQATWTWHTRRQCCPDLVSEIERLNTKYKEAKTRNFKLEKSLAEWQAKSKRYKVEWLTSKKKKAAALATKIDKQKVVKSSSNFKIILPMSQEVAALGSRSTTMFKSLFQNADKVEPEMRLAEQWMEKPEVDSEDLEHPVLRADNSLAVVDKKGIVQKKSGKKEVGKKGAVKIKAINKKHIEK
ncbi:hypothetical protein M7I_4724 [Glarea lozoyensis 74030]|uniref:Uncharacterized protein n=1 Tax=Glarea lozoyensis (strain ATCC 74030 / MF5533) TaxID=1104152 RepID=H0EPY5_GLAL7|nr:hypothetical protein M7I_4724 [Glarea lozoyensis 74030]